MELNRIEERLERRETKLLLCQKSFAMKYNHESVSMTYQRTQVVQHLYHRPVNVQTEKGVIRPPSNFLDTITLIFTSKEHFDCCLYFGRFSLLLVSSFSFVEENYFLVFVFSGRRLVCHSGFLKRIVGAYHFLVLIKHNASINFNMKCKQRKD